MLALSARGVLLGLLAACSGVHAIGQETCVAFTPSSSSFPIVSNGAATPVLLSADDWGGVQRAASDFAADIERVTGVSPALYNYSTTTTTSIGSSAIIVGTLGHSALIDQVVNATGLDVSGIAGQWEAFLAQEVADPLPGISSAYVIVGADKRGTIYGLYDHSEQFGVSPWYWFADVPTTPNAEIYVASAGCAHGPPTVKYRGIFLNDEQPALQNWAMVTFTNGTGAPLTGSPFNHYFYTHLFELLLRMKANYLWPAMWASAFGVDDLQNQPLANYYGIVMGTSHEEPMMRSIPVEWTLFGVGPWDYSTNKDNIYPFWVEGAERAKPYENIFTVGMRGDGDEPIEGAGDGNIIALLEEIISDQRTILTDTFPDADVTEIPQMWALYQEVLGYYYEGMTVPDDVTLLWTDDLFGNIDRFPLVSERNRTGGAGVYFHYDLVGPPRSYKWITSSQIQKTYEQMQLAVAREATRIWILNVGDLKPYEMQTEFFITLGWDADVWTPDNLDSFILAWAQREFDLDAGDAQTVVDIIAFVSRFNSNRKPEYLNATSYSLYNYREAERMLADWAEVSASAQRIGSQLSAEMQPAYFQLVLHPVEASYTLANLWISAGYNNLRASQAMLSTNQYGEAVESLFRQDYALELEYHSILDGKWDHMMDQTHVMYAYWQEPYANTMPPISWYQTRNQALSGAMRIVPEGTQAAWPGDNQYQCAAGYDCPNPTLYLDNYVPAGNRYFIVGLGGPSAFTFTATSNATWLDLNITGTYVSPSTPEQRVYVSADWDQVEGTQYALIMFNASVPNQPAMSFTATFVAEKNEVPADFTGFVEGDGGVSIEAGHAARNTSVDGIAWALLPGYGRTDSGVTPWPRGGADLNFSVGAGPSIEYDFYTFHSDNGTGNVTVTSYISPSANALGPDRPLGFAMQLDGGAPQATYYIPVVDPGTQPPAWSEWVSDNIITVPLNFNAPPGAHTLTIWMIEPAVVFQKFVIDTGGVQPSYLGPPESIFVNTGAA